MSNTIALALMCYSQLQLQKETILLTKLNTSEANLRLSYLPGKSF